MDGALGTSLSVPEGGRGRNGEGRDRQRDAAVRGGLRGGPSEEMRGGGEESVHSREETGGGRAGKRELQSLHSEQSTLILHPLVFEEKEREGGEAESCSASVDGEGMSDVMEELFQDRQLEEEEHEAAAVAAEAEAEKRSQEASMRTLSAGRQSGSICEHGHKRYYCKECGGGGLCEHGRQRHMCKECGGRGICEHCEYRFRCRVCSSHNFCEHDRYRASCKDCGFVRTEKKCKHGRQPHLCKDCGGTSICEHNKERRRCKECGGSGFCEHGKLRHFCVRCGGKSMCEHGRERRRCRDCGGVGICEHGKQRFDCKVCGNSKIFCEHGRRRYNCRGCGGGGICEHGHRRRACKQCKGMSKCRHKQIRADCEKCRGEGKGQKAKNESSKRETSQAHLEPREEASKQKGKKRKQEECVDKGETQTQAAPPNRVPRAAKSRRLGESVPDSQAQSELPTGSPAAASGGRGPGGGGVAKVSSCEWLQSPLLICKHGLERNRCHDSGCRSICVHGRRPTRCKDCKVDGGGAVLLTMSEGDSVGGTAKTREGQRGGRGGERAAVAVSGALFVASSGETGAKVGESSQSAASRKKEGAAGESGGVQPKRVKRKKVPTKYNESSGREIEEERASAQNMEEGVEFLSGNHQNDGVPSSTDGDEQASGPLDPGPTFFGLLEESD
uniref:Uncharacterized protein n=1 Tax=Chromera velia CCMP2878 TaxID=1169474 RepID=A0A0G4HMP2_9ALVE|eukprot:Cvel_7515.t1-p1 / transcript=Cvel_7515.t1 / gene=Cvel_7515 / organism=Chromera_velia_CCMP2878 / gene_product=Zinc finger protein 571, putative / transcript_product=Zinc finger protein 571, putative / location=Cvel_scaffold395:4933-6945(+) / protein_length=671 / sequence_SO=supercontig / SO=protein_coding / is_pseudo=false